MKRLFATSLLISAALVLSACHTPKVGGVKPWERDLLAKPDMAWDPDPQEATLRSHIFFSKEAASGGSGAGGGGCGCN